MSDGKLPASLPRPNGAHPKLQDRRPITMGDLLEPPPPTEFTQAPVRREEDEDLTGIRSGSSAKIEQLIHLLKLTPGTEKSLVFSQFTSFLDKVWSSDGNSEMCLFLSPL